MVRGLVTWITVGVSIIGALCALLVVPRSVLSIGYIAWHAAPYFLAAVLGCMIPRYGIAWLGAAVVMTAADAWLVAESALGTKSPYLMSVGLLATLKLPVLFPIGVALGAWVARTLRG